MKTPPDQQPLSRTIGRRVPRTSGPPDADARAAWAQMARYRTRAPKGVFFYSSAAEMQADRDRWTVAAVVERTRELEARRASSEK